MKKRVILDKNRETYQGVLFPEIVPSEDMVEKNKRRVKKGALRREGEEKDARIKKMSPKEFSEFLRRRDRDRYENARRILKEEGKDE